VCVCVCVTSVEYNIHQQSVQQRFDCSGAVFFVALVWPILSSPAKSRNTLLAGGHNLTFPRALPIHATLLLPVRPAEMTPWQSWEWISTVTGYGIL